MDTGKRRREEGKNLASNTTTNNRIMAFYNGGIPWKPPEIVQIDLLALIINCYTQTLDLNSSHTRIKDPCQ